MLILYFNAAKFSIKLFSFIYYFSLVVDEAHKLSQVTYVTMVPRVGNESLRPLGVAMGNAVSETRALKHTYIKTPLVGRRQPCSAQLRSLALNRGSRLYFTPRPTLFFLPACFCCLVSSHLLKRLFLHGSPN